MRCFINGSAERKTISEQRKTLGLIVLRFSLFVLSCPAWACPNCKDAITEGTARGYNLSILWMISVVVAVVAVIGGLVWKASHRKTELPDSPHGQSS
jgi:heme/copper-type cytochrome/quinol oxidase subunit 2